MMMMTIFCFVLVLSQGTLSASLPESSDTSKNLESFVQNLFTGSNGLTNELNYEEIEDKIPQNEVETEDVSIPENGLVHNQGFHAYLSGPRCYHTGAAIKFNVAPVNIANRYNVHTGVFVVATSGLYSFTWTVASEEKNWFVSELRVNGVLKGNIMTNSYVNGKGNGIHPATGYVIVNVRRGDHVYIRFLGGHGCIVKSDRMTRSTFSGFLLH